MEKYRMPEEVYRDNHDREIIRKLKELIKPVLAAEKEMEETGEDKDGRHQKLRAAFTERAIALNRSKSKVIRKMIEDDMRKDHLVKSTPIPEHVKCNECGQEMTFYTHTFNYDNTEIRFVFSCPNKHLPMKCTRANGKEYLPPKPKCTACSSEDFTVTQEVIDDTLVITDVCHNCGHVEKMELDNFQNESEPINEDERAMYCTQYESENPLEHLHGLLQIIGEVVKNPKKEYDLEKVQKMTIPQIENRLKERLEKETYIKLSFDKPKMGRNVIVEYSVQDGSDRNATESKSRLRRILIETLMETNWRMYSKITYRMGYIQGKLKGFENEADLQEIAEEIHYWEKMDISGKKQ